MKLRAGEWLVLGGAVLIAAFAPVVGAIIYAAGGRKKASA